MQTVREQFEGIVQQLVRDVINAVPKVLVGILLVIIALIAASVLERLLRIALVRLRFDSLVRRTGVDNWLQKVGIRQSFDEFIPRLFYFLLLFLFARTAADALGLDAISGAIGAVMDYLPNLIAALLILVFGSAASQFIGRAVTSAAASAGADYARPLGGVVSGIILFILVVMALAQLKVDTEMIRLFSMTLLAAFALAFGISFGFGSRDAMRNIVAGFYVRKTFRIGEELEIAGHRGTLQAIHPTRTVLRGDTEDVSIANAAFMEESARHVRR